MTIKYLKGAKNLAELRKLYIRAMKENHPDNGGDANACKTINAEYDFLSGKLPKEASAAAETETEKKSFNDLKDEVLKNIVSSLAGYDVNIEVVGSWVWVDGNTFPVKDILKEMGFRWSKSRKKWHYSESEKAYYKGSRKSFDTLRAVYGSFAIENEKRVAIA